MEIKNKGGRPREYDHAQVTKMYAQGISKSQIAATLGCSWRTIHRIVCGDVLVPIVSEKIDDMAR